MSTISQLYRLSNCVISNYKTVLHGRTNWFNSIQTCNYTKKSAESKLGIEKPKRPLTPFFKFMTQMRPALLAKNPGISSRDAIAWTSKHWQELDAETKTQMTKEYEKDLEDYKKIKAMYQASLTDEQKADIQKVKEEMAAAKEKRKLKAEYKEMGKPKRPMSSYLLYVQDKRHAFSGKDLKEYQQQLKTEWAKLPSVEKAQYEKQALSMMDKYKKDLETWELKMISGGRSDLIRMKPTREKKTKSAKPTQ